MTALTNGTASVFARGTQPPDDAWLAKAIAEAAIDPQIPVVDPHMHLWQHKSGYKYFVEEFGRDVAASGHDVQATVYVECGQMYRASGPAQM